MIVNRVRLLRVRQLIQTPVTCYEKLSSGTGMRNAVIMIFDPRTLRSFGAFWFNEMCFTTSRSALDTPPVETRYVNTFQIWNLLIMIYRDTF